MGTTQRISPGVTGEPNWGGLNRSITQIAKTVEREQDGGYGDIPDNENELQQGEENQTLDQKQHTIEYQAILKKRNQHLKTAFGNLVKTGGGSRNISTGKSKSIGQAGLRSSKRIVSFFLAVGEKGIQQALTDIGFDLVGKKLQDVLDYLLVYSTDSSAGMDETAANKASCEVLNDLAKQANNDLERFEEIIRTLADGQELSNLLCKFWGYYIFEHLSQRFQEKITQQKGEGISAETFRIIKEDILGQVTSLNEKRDIAKINWKGEQGRVEIEKIFQSITNILSNEN